MRTLARSIAYETDGVGYDGIVDGEDIRRLSGGDAERRHDAIALAPASAIHHPMQHLGGFEANSITTLDHATQRGRGQIAHHLVVVDANHGHIFRDAQSQSPQRFEHMAGSGIVTRH